MLDAGGREQRRVHQRARADHAAARVELACDASNNTQSNPRRTSSARKRTKAVRSGVGSCAAKPQNRLKLARSSKASARRKSERSCHVASRSARNSANGGQPASPLAEAEMPASRRFISVQSTRAATSSSDVPLRGPVRPTASRSCPIRRRAIPASSPLRNCIESDPTASEQATRAQVS